MEVDFCGEGDGVIQLDLGECLQVEDQSLEMNEEEGRKNMEAVVLLNGLYFSLTEIAEIVTNDFRLDKFSETIVEIVLVFDFD